MDLDQFNYDLPDNLIGQTAIEPRDSCRLLVFNRHDGSINHRIFSDLVSILDDSCVLVLNDTKVFPARLFGKKYTGGKVQLLLLKQISPDTYTAIGTNLKKGNRVTFENSLEATILSKDDAGEMQVRFNCAGPDLWEKIDQLGTTPLPHYIASGEDETNLRDQYQTVYAKERGSSAAPTAGLHFTNRLLSDLSKRGIQIENVTLHVGLGTFRYPTQEQIKQKTLHSEWGSISPDTAARLSQAKKQGKKIITVGTTSCRLLETMSDKSGKISAGAGETDIFIQPGYQFKFVDGLITNFHLPKTSLLMLVSALTTSSVSPTRLVNFSDSPIGLAYQEAIKEKYKFFSFGDAMLII